VNDDAQLDSRCVESLVQHAQTGETLIGCLIYNSNGTVNHSGVSFTNGWPNHMDRGQNPYVIKGCRVVPAVTFATVMIKRDLWEELGGLDDRYFFGFEDTDFCMRAWEVGEAPMVCESAKVTHDEFGTRGTENDQKNGMLFFTRWSVPDPLSGNIRGSEAVRMSEVGQTRGWV